ncbi:MAG: L,D-transpeptidase family protein [Thermomicrobiales bacterium]
MRDFLPNQNDRHRLAKVQATRRTLIGGIVAGAAGLSLGLGRFSSLAPAPAAAQQVTEGGASKTPAPTGRYFAATGHNMRDPFLARWSAAGGEAVLGVPISEERFAEGVGIVQSFEAVTLVYDPSLAAPWDLQSQHLPEGTISATAPASARTAVAGCADAASPTCQNFTDVGHTVSGSIAAFWAQHGDLAIFGKPLSEPFVEKDSGLIIQLFERAVLEDHNFGRVLVRPLARQLAESGGLLSDPAFVPAPPTNGNSQLVRADEGLRLRGAASSDADIVALLPDNAEFIAAADGAGGSWVPGYADGYAGWVSSAFLKSPAPVAALSSADWNPGIWQGIALGQTNVRKQPSTTAGVAKMLASGDPITVRSWVKGEAVFPNADEWAQTGDGGFIYARNVGRNAPVLPPPLPADAPTDGPWIDVHLTQQLMTAYDGRTPVRVSVTTTGMAGWETPTGFFQILVRVPNETMTGGALGAESYFKLDDVLFTQYFTDFGHAIHFAWWRTPETIGRPGSHGCLNLLLYDARFYWDWAQIGTPIYIHV